MRSVKEQPGKWEKGRSLFEQQQGVKKIDQRTLKSYINKKLISVPVLKIGYCIVPEAHTESVLAKHVKNLMDQFHGLSSVKFREPDCE